VPGRFVNTLFSKLKPLLKIHSFLARKGGQIWQVEEIGKVWKDIVHIIGLFLADHFEVIYLFLMMAG
jgi:hypothetical protein